MLSNPLALHLLHNTNSNRELTKKTFLDCNALMNFYSGQRAAGSGQKFSIHYICDNPTNTQFSEQFTRLFGTKAYLQQKNPTNMNSKSMQKAASTDT